MRDKVAAVLGIAVVVVFFSGWTGRHAGRAYNTFRLRSRGEVTTARVEYASTWFSKTWPYRVEYRFEVGGAAYEEQVYYAGRRTRDIGAPVSRTTWHAARETDAIAVLYLPADPSVNIPLDQGVWGTVRYLYEIERVLFGLSLALLIVGAALSKVSGEARSVVKAGAKLFGCTVVGGVYGMVVMEFGLRGTLLVTARGDMDVLDLLVTALAVVATGVIPAGLAVGLIKVGLGGD